MRAADGHASRSKWDVVLGQLDMKHLEFLIGQPPTSARNS